jgi:hypothetical protein
MKSIKRMVMISVIVLACAGIYGAFRNLPIVSGCAFYGDCPQAAETTNVDAGEPLAAAPRGATVDSATP